MLTHTVPDVDPAPKTERLPLRETMALILGKSAVDGLPFPYGIVQNGGDSDLLCLQFHMHAEVRAWHTFFRVDPSEPSTSKDGQRSILIDYGRGWNGWTVGLYAFEPIETPEESSAVPEPGHVYDCCGKTGRISRHEPWCPSLTAGDTANHATAEALRSATVTR